MKFSVQQTRWMAAITLLVAVAFTSSIEVKEHPFLEKIKLQIQGWSNANQASKIYLHLDRKFIKPGDDIWFKAYVRDVHSYKGDAQANSLQVQLLNPRGAVIQTKNLTVQAGSIASDFQVGKDLVGGIYKVRAFRSSPTEFGAFEQEITVQKSVLPNLKMKLQFERKAFGAGSLVEARLDLNALNNDALANYSFDVLARLNGKEILRKKAQTDANGRAYIDFKLPAHLETNDGLLTILLDYNGQRESISRSIPIVLGNIDVQFFPEGGDAVVNLPTKIAFKALNEFGKPADIKGEIFDGAGEVVATFESFHQGMGAFDFLPDNEHDYCARITEPSNMTDCFELPAFLPVGFQINVEKVDKKYITVRVNGTAEDDVFLVLQARQKIYHTEQIKVHEEEVRVQIPVKNLPIGVAQLTLFDSKEIARCERLVFVNADKQLNIEISTNKEKYEPREKVKMTIKVTDERGMPMPGDFSLAVVDDKLLSFADDKQGHLLSHILLQSDLKGDIVEPNFYFDKKEAKAAPALDYLMLTQGWRRFTWNTILANDWSHYTTNITKAPSIHRDLKDRKRNKFTETKEVFELEDDMIIEPPRSAAPPPPPVIEEVPEEELMDDMIIEEEIMEDEEPAFMDQTIEEHTVIDRPQEAGKKRQANMPPPPPPPPAVAEIFKIVEQMPVFKSPRCEGAADKEKCAQELMLQYISNRLKYPKKAEENNVEGTCVVRFIVGKDGNIKDLEVIRDIGAGCGNAALHAVEGMQFTPGKQRGRTVEVIYNMPVRFDLSGNITIDTAPAKPNKIQGRQFYSPNYKNNKNPEARTDFRETIFWQPIITTDTKGKATVEFYTSDAITAFRATVEGFASSGDLGRGDALFYTQLPFSMVAKVPATVISGDIVRVPLTLTNNTKRHLNGELKIDAPSNFTASPFEASQSIAAGESKTIYLEYIAGNDLNTYPFRMAFKARGVEDVFETSIETLGRGFPVKKLLAGSEQVEQFQLSINQLIPNSIQAKLTVHTNALDDMVASMERMMRQPSGCFEQTSSSNYPNLLALDFLKTTGQDRPEVRKRAEQYLASGYGRLVGYESPKKGFHWWGNDPGHEALTAYGLMQFIDMARVYAVDQTLIARTAEWMMQKRDGKGSWNYSGRGAHSWAGTNAVRDAYIAWAMCAADFGEKIKPELDKAYTTALKSKDAYQWALLANAMLEMGDEQRAAILINKLIKAQDKNGSWTGETASVVNSRGIGLQIETTALAALALMQKGGQKTAVNRAMQFITENKSWTGYGNTQSTVLALKAMIKHATAQQARLSNGTFTLVVNGEKAAAKAFESGAGAIILEDWASLLKAGNNTIEMRFDDEKTVMPYTLEVSYFTTLPPSSPDCKLALTTTLANKSVKMGETVRLTTTIKNTTKAGVASPLAIIGIPAGASLQPWQLKELMEHGKVDFYELFDGKLAVHFEGFAQEEERVLHLDLKADIPGTYEAAASEAYLYYENEDKVWSKPSKLVIEN